MDEKLVYRYRFKNLKKRQDVWRPLTKFISQYIRPSDTILDIGCGYGEFINNVRATEKIGLDINPDTRKYLASDVRFLHGSATMIPLSGGFVDKVFASNFFEHITKKEILGTVKEIGRILKKDGLVIVLQPNIRFLGNDFWSFSDHITPIDDRALEEVFGSYGFKLKKRILKFVPYTMGDVSVVTSWLVELYLAIPAIWPIFGKQSFLVFGR